MVRNYLLSAATVAIVAGVSQAVVLNPVLNDIYVNPPGTDDTREFIEIRGTPGSSLNGFTLLEIEGDGTGAGVIDLARSLSGLSIGTSGYLILGHNYETTIPYTIASGTNVANLNRSPNSTLENGSITFAIVQGFTGAVGNDLDTNDDGVIDVTLPWSSIADNIGWAEDSLVDVDDKVYFGAVIANNGTPPGTIDGASRSFNILTPSDASAWFNSDVIDDATDLTYDPARLAGATPTASGLTPGDANVPEPAALSLLGLAGLMGLRRRR